MKKLLGLAVALCSAASWAGDSCRLYSSLNSAGGSQTWDLPGVSETYSPAWWSTSSRRAIGSELAASVYDNAESVRIEAFDSNVELYVFTGDAMDGIFQRIFCEQGNVCTWNFGSMRNQVRSMSCQRDFGLPLEIPTRDIADAITEGLDSELPTSSSINNSWIRYGQLQWTNVRSRCEREDVGCGGNWEDKYKDTLEYRGKFELDINNWVSHYDARFRFWINPVVRTASHTLKFEETYFKITVESGLISQTIADGLADGIQPLFNGEQDLGDSITEQVHAAIEDVAGFFAPVIINGNERLYVAFQCNGAKTTENTPQYPDYTYTAYNLSTPCGYGMPVKAYAPIIRLLKAF